MESFQSDCKLCASAVEGGASFCCKGCEAVYEILSKQKALDQKLDHPLYLGALKWGIIANSASLEQRVSKREGTVKWRILVEGMWCPFCSEIIALLLNKLSGIVHASIDYMTDIGVIEFDPKQVSKSIISKEIKSFGYEAKELSDPEVKEENKRLTFRFFIALFSSLNVMMFAYPLYATYFDLDLESLKPVLAWLSLILTVPALAAGYPIFKKMALQLRLGWLGMESLVGIGVVGSLILSFIEMGRGTYHIYFDTATVVITFVLLGKMIESKGKFSTKDALIKLVHSLPKKGRKKMGTSFQVVPLKTISKGDSLLVLRGEKIPLDGVVQEGEGSCDESVITGEALPKWKKGGEGLVAGSYLVSGWLIYQVSEPQESSTVQKIALEVERGLSRKKKEMSLLDQVIKHFTPAILLLAIIVLFLPTLGLIDSMESVRRSLAILLIACPCAIGVAIPLIEGKLFEAGAKKSILIRNKDALFKFAHVTTLFCDKTGTLTEGKFQHMAGLEKLDRGQKEVLKALSTFASHPIAKALEELLGEVQGVPLLYFQEWLGAGVEGTYRGIKYGLGSYQWAKERNVKGIVPPEGNVSIYFFEDERCLSIIAFGDPIRDEAEPFLLGFADAKRIIISGDHPATTHSIASKLPVEAWEGGLNPLQKMEKVKNSSRAGGYVAFIGDGVNDAPSLSEADVSIAMMNGADMARNVSDFLLTSPSLKALAEFKEIVRKGEKLAKQNLFWAFIYNIGGVALAALGFMTPLFATFAMLASSFLVTLNSKRL